MTRRPPLQLPHPPFYMGFHDRLRSRIDDRYDAMSETQQIEYESGRYFAVRAGAANIPLDWPRAAEMPAPLRQLLLQIFTAGETIGFFPKGDDGKA